MCELKFAKSQITSKSLQKLLWKCFTTVFCMLQNPYDWNPPSKGQYKYELSTAFWDSKQGATWNCSQIVLSRCVKHFTVKATILNKRFWPSHIWKPQRAQWSILLLFNCSVLNLCILKKKLALLLLTYRQDTNWPEIHVKHHMVWLDMVFCSHSVLHCTCQPITCQRYKLQKETNY